MRTEPPSSKAGLSHTATGGFRLLERDPSGISRPRQNGSGPGCFCAKSHAACNCTSTLQTILKKSHESIGLIGESCPKNN